MTQPHDLEDTAVALRGMADELDRRSKVARERIADRDTPLDLAWLQNIAGHESRFRINYFYSLRFEVLSGSLDVDLVLEERVSEPSVSVSTTLPLHTRGDFLEFCRLMGTPFVDGVPQQDPE